ncbi:MAG: DNA-binding response regulator [Saprospirales bacterium]|nr:MAG: DNA-binding response regulator [Saprospirales bacterium]
MNILLIEDDSRLAGLIRSALEQNAYQVTVAYDGETGLKMALNSDFDLIISDLMLPGIDGLQVVSRIRAVKESIPILMLTALSTTDDKVYGFEAGADDYLVKPFEFRELFARIKALLKRSVNSVGDSKEVILEYDEIKMDLNSKTVYRAGMELSLTPKEYKLLEFMLKNPKRVLSREEIAAEVWDTHFDTGTNFIDVYINYLRKKVDKPFSHKLIHTKSGMGFQLKRKKKS